MLYAVAGEGPSRAVAMTANRSPSTVHPSSSFTRQLGIEYPVICGAMFPCSNPELVAAVSEAGGIGIVQPISLTYVYGYDFRAGLRQIRTLTSKPFGFNALIEQSSKAYHNKMVQWVDIALEEGVRFFITSLGNPKWVADRVHAGSTGGDRGMVRPLKAISDRDMPGSEVDQRGRNEERRNAPRSPVDQFGLGLFDQRQAADARADCRSDSSHRPIHEAH